MRAESATHSNSYPELASTPKRTLTSANAHNRCNFAAFAAFAACFALKTQPFIAAIAAAIFSPPPPPTTMTTLTIVATFPTQKLGYVVAADECEASRGTTSPTQKTTNFTVKLKNPTNFANLQQSTHSNPPSKTL